MWACRLEVLPPLLSHLLESTVAHCGARPALRWRQGALDYHGLAAEVGSRAARLREHGVEAGRAVALLLPNSPGFVIDFFAVAMCGGIAVPLNPQFKPEEALACLAGCDLAAILACGASAALAEALAGRQAAPPVLVDSGPVGPAGSREFPGARDGGDVLYGFSSGSTGVPKRIVRTQENLGREADHLAAAAGLAPEDVIFGAVPFHHAHGLGNCVLAAVRSGATLVIDEAFEPRRALTAIERDRVSVFPGVPFIFRMLAATQPDRGVDAGALRLCFSAGAALPHAVFDAFDKRFGKPVRQLYGCTEAGSVTLNLDPDASGTAASVGLPMGDVKISVVDAAGNPVPTGTEGEVVIESPALGRSDTASEDFRAGRFFSGDLARLDTAGRLTLTGRKKLFISTAAGKVDPIEVERCVAGCPGVSEVVVVGLTSPSGDDLVKAVVVPGETLDARAGAKFRRAVVRHCRERLVAHKVPRRVELRTEIPRSPLGKVLRKYLV